MTKEQLLGEIEHILRTVPSGSSFASYTAESMDWLGRANAAVESWDFAKGVMFRLSLGRFNLRQTSDNLAALLTLLHQARHDLRMQTLGPVSIAVGAGMPFDYFDEIRKILETARKDVLFVDPYLDAEFVSRYLGHITAGVNVRMLARQKLATLIPAVKLFAQQSKLKLDVRSATGFHDRYVFVDRLACYHSGASFKDGAVKVPTTLTQITDAFGAVLQTYENIWSTAKIEYQ